MNGTQLNLFPSIDQRTADTLALIHGDPLHDNDRRKVVEAIIAEADAHNGLVDPNAVRTRLDHGVYPKVIGAVYAALTGPGKPLVKEGWIENTDSKGGNVGKLIPLRRWVGAR